MRNAVTLVASDALMLTGTFAYPAAADATIAKLIANGILTGWTEDFRCRNSI